MPVRLVHFATDLPAASRFTDKLLLYFIFSQIYEAEIKVFFAENHHCPQRGCIKRLTKQYFF